MPTEYDVSVRTGGSDYVVGDVLIIEGKRLGGDIPDHNLFITVAAVSLNGTITSVSVTGTPKASPNFRTYVLEPIQNVSGRLDKILYR